MKKAKRIYFSTRKEFRDWLKKNHLKERKVAVIRYKKHTRKPSPSHIELMHEAICFGWIDTTIKRIDDEKYMINFAARNEKGKWSRNTLGYAKKLIKEGKMSSHGLKMYNHGRKNKTHDHGIPKNPEMPPELKKELEKNETAKKNFEMFSPSAKRTYYRWILYAKGNETRMKRSRIVAKLAEENRKMR